MSGGVHLRELAPEQHSSEETSHPRRVVDDCVRFDCLRIEPQTSALKTVCLTTTLTKRFNLDLVCLNLSIFLHLHFFCRKNTSCPASTTSSPSLSSRIPSSTEGLSQIKATSFSSSKLLPGSETSFSTSNSVFSFTDLVSPVQRDSHNSSLSSLSARSSSPKDALSLSTSSRQFHITLGEDQMKINKEQTSLSNKASPESRNSGIWKKLPFYRKERHFKKQNSKEDLPQAKLGSPSHSIEVEDFSQASEMLEKFKEENEALELEVSCHVVIHCIPLPSSIKLYKHSF